METKQQNENIEPLQALVRVSKSLTFVCLLFVVCLIMILISLLSDNISDPKQELLNVKPVPINAFSSNVSSGSIRQIPAGSWKSPDETTIPAGKQGEMIRYGRELIVHTARYLGPKGSVACITNGMNCQNCHLAGGTKLFGNDYAGFISSYPKMSGRSGKVEPASERIAECFERSLAGKVPDTSGHEVRSILAYMKWIGKNVKKGDKLFGSATEKLSFMDRAASPAKGKKVFLMKCQSCHGTNGEGLLNPDKKGYTNPPLWGKHSYNDGAGMYRLSNFAGFVKNNMPFGATYESPQLTDEEAWDVAAYVNSQPRPHKDQHNDWKDLRKKPFDFPFGPYIDRFSEEQHKFGPFKPIKEARK